MVAGKVYRLGAGNDKDATLLIIVVSRIEVVLVDNDLVFVDNTPNWCWRRVTEKAVRLAGNARKK